MFGRTHQWNHQIQDFSLSDFWLLIQFAYLVIDLIRFSISSLFSLGRFYIPRTLSTPSRLSNLLAYSCSQYSFTILFISVQSVVMSSLSFLILEIWVFSLFFLVSLAEGLPILLTYSKNQILVLFFFSIVFLILWYLSFTSSEMSRKNWDYRSLNLLH